MWGAFQAQVFSFAPSLFNLPIAKKILKVETPQYTNTHSKNIKISSNIGPATGIGSKITTVGQAI
jgi:hypothetical protein